MGENGGAMAEADHILKRLRAELRANAGVEDLRWYAFTDCLG